MKSSFYYRLFFVLLTVGVTVWYLYVNGNPLSISRRLDRASELTPTEFIYFVKNRINDGDYQEAMTWFRKKSLNTTNFVVPLLYAERLALSSMADRDKISEKQYTSAMVDAGIMFVFSDITMTGDYMRCQDKTARTAMASIRGARFQPIYDFLISEATNAQREQVMSEGFALEEKIGKRPPNQFACANGIGSVVGGNKGFIPTAEWASLRLQLIERMKASYRRRFLAGEKE